MALQGSLETFELPDVLRLLATTSKTGLLALEGDRGIGNIWFDEGAIVGAVSDHEKIDGPDAVVFDLLRMAEGTFVFDPEAKLVRGDTSFAVDDVVESAQAKLAEWREIESVVPTLDVFARLMPELDRESVTVTADEWKVLAMLGAGTTIRRLGERMELREVPVSRLVRDLVADGFVVLEAVVTGAAPGLDLPPIPSAADWDAPADTDVEAAEPDAVSDAAVEPEFEAEPEPETVPEFVAEPEFVAAPVDVADVVPAADPEPITEKWAAVDALESQYAEAAYGNDELPPLDTAVPAPDLDIPSPPPAFDSGFGVDEAAEPPPPPPAYAPLTLVDDSVDPVGEAVADEAAVDSSQDAEDAVAPDADAAADAETVDGEGDGVNRSLLLRFLSSVKD